MQIFVKTLTGKTVPLMVAPVDTIESVKAQLCAEEGVELYYAGKHLSEELTAAEYEIQQEATIEMVMPVMGGKGKKKKKRIFTKPKKNAHRHKNVVMRVLKYYKVEGEGDEVKVTHERSECRMCGSGVFLAKHKDRQTCGKCALTFVTKK